MRKHLTMEHFVKAAERDVKKIWNTLLQDKTNDVNALSMHINELCNLTKFLEETRC